jgi:hypothetical protein
LTELFRSALEQPAAPPDDWPAPRPAWASSVSPEELRLLDQSLTLESARRLLLCLLLYTPLSPAQMAAVLGANYTVERTLQDLVEILADLLPALFEQR